ncbi:MAG: hypothetical protein IKE03_06700 [Blautia sp.]|nr:hypothetical protein [Blautia sp.]
MSANKHLIVTVKALAAVLMVFLAAGAVQANDDPASASASPGGRSWTLCLYLCGSNLESRQGWATKTLSELTEAAIPDDVTVLVQLGGAKEWRYPEETQNGLRLVVRDGETVEVGMAEQGLMGESETLADFLDFSQREYPAEHTAVVFWDHGGGPLKGVCFDETASFDALSLDELGEAIAKGVEARGGQPYDIVGFDACLMGSVETAVALADYADWMVASEEIEAGAGWDYAPIVAAMGEDGDDPRAVARAMCDGYKEKSSRRRRDAAVTLAALDLKRLPVLRKAMEEVYTALEQNVGLGIGSLRMLAFGAQVAEDFGGSSGSEGRSNLVDLKGLADGCAQAYGTEEVPWDTLSDAIEEVVDYRVYGTATTGASGISIWYPVTLKDAGLDAYVAMSPFTKYASVLEKLFSLDIGAVTFSDAGSVDEDDVFHVTIDPAAAESFYDIYVVNRRTDSGYEDHNVDRLDDWEALRFGWQPALAVEVVLDGMPLDVQVVSYTDDYIVFSSPILLNGKDCFLRFGWVYDEENPEGGYYELSGVWNGVDHASGMAGRYLGSLEPGDVITALSLDGDQTRGSITVEGDVEITDIPMEAGEYECWFVAKDLYGREYSSDVCGYVVDESGDVTVRMMDRKGDLTDEG